MSFQALVLTISTMGVVNLYVNKKIATKLTADRGTTDALPSCVMRGFITEMDFEKCDEAFPGIVRYYRELQDKPKTFLELFWAWTHRSGVGAEPCPVATQAASHHVSR